MCQINVEKETFRVINSAKWKILTYFVLIVILLSFSIDFEFTHVQLLLSWNWKHREHRNSCPCRSALQNSSLLQGLVHSNTSQNKNGKQERKDSACKAFSNSDCATYWLRDSENHFKLSEPHVSSSVKWGHVN